MFNSYHLICTYVCVRVFLTIIMVIYTHSLWLFTQIYKTHIGVGTGVSAFMVVHEHGLWLFSNNNKTHMCVCRYMYVWLRGHIYT